MIKHFFRHFVKKRSLHCSQAKKLESSGAIKEERYKELCRLIIEAFTKHEGIMQNEAVGALNAIVKEFQAHPLHLFESMLQTDKRTRFVFLNLYCNKFMYSRDFNKILYS